MKRVEAILLGVALALSATSAASKESIPQYMSGAHRITFSADGYTLSDGTYELRVEFTGARAVLPVSEGRVGRAPEGTPALEAFAQATFSGLWSGIDVTYDAPADGILRSTWSLQPGADAAAIRLRYDRPVTVTAAGGLLISFDTGAMIESRPVAWQDAEDGRQPVDVAFVQLDEHQIGFRVGAHRADLPLTIDPISDWLEWRTFFAGPREGQISAVAVDGSGNVYLAGSDRDGWCYPNPPPHSDCAPERPDWPKSAHAPEDGWYASVIKLNPHGEHLWHTFIGDGAHRGLAVAVDCHGAVYVGGTKEGEPWELPPTRDCADSGTQGFVTKLSSTGSPLWMTCVGSKVNALAADCSGNVFVGASIGSDAHERALPAKLKSSDGESVAAGQWKQVMTSATSVNAIALDGEYTYLTGGARVDATSPFLPQLPFVTRLSKDGVVDWTEPVEWTSIAGGPPVWGTSIAVDDDGFVYFTARNLNASFFAKMRPDKHLEIEPEPLGTYAQQERYLTRGLAVSGSGDGAEVYVVGDAHPHPASTPGVWASPAVPQTTGSPEAWVAKLSPANGDVTWNTFMGAQNAGDWAFGVAPARGGGVFVGGYSELKWADTVWGDPLVQHWDPVGNASTDGFAMKIRGASACPEDQVCDEEACHAKRVEAWGTYVACIGVATSMFYQDLDHARAAENHANDCRRAYFLEWGPPCTGPRFSYDNVDGTITDYLTGLVWEKKTAYDHNDQSPDLHDADKKFTWSDGTPWYESGTAFDEFLKTLNDSGFGGSNGWRLPTHAELQTLMAAWLGVPPEDGPGMVPEFPDAASNSEWAYWSSTTAPLIHGGCKEVGQCALNAVFDPPSGTKPQSPTAMMIDAKENGRHLRAVRGGL